MANTNVPNQRPVLPRVDELEQQVKNVYSILDSAFMEVRQTLGTSLQTLEAVMAVLDKTSPDFTKSVSEMMETKRTERLEKKAQRERDEIKYLLENNKIKQADTIGPSSVIIGRLFSPDDKVMNVGYEQTIFQNFSEHARAALLGQAVGFLYESPAKTKFEVLEIYEEVPPTTEAEPTTPALAEVVADSATAEVKQ